MSFFSKVLVLIAAAVAVQYLPPRYPVPEIFGTVSPGFEEVAEVFRKNFELGIEKSHAGSAFSAYYQGEKVVDLWAGYADTEAGLLWKEDSLTLMYGSTKGVVALVMAVLADRGLVDFKNPVIDYWPSFGMKSKEEITVEMLLEHEAGLPIIFNGFSFDLLRDRERMDQQLVLSEMVWRPGTAHGYHAVTFGFLVDAIVRKVDPKGRTLGQFFQEEIAEPFDIDIFIGTPKKKYYRLTRPLPVEPSYLDILSALASNKEYRKIVKQWLLPDEGSSELYKKVLENCGEMCQWWRYVDPELIQLEFPSMTGTGTARAVAKLFGIIANGGKIGNRTLLSEKYIDEYKYDRREATGDVVLFDYPTRWKYGMYVIPQVGNDSEATNLFGAGGEGGQIGYADPSRKLGFGYLTRYMVPVGLPHMDPRSRSLIESTRRAVDGLEK